MVSKLKLMLVNCVACQLYWKKHKTHTDTHTMWAIISKTQPAMTHSFTTGKHLGEER